MNSIKSHEMQLYQTTESMEKLHLNAFVRKLESEILKNV